MQKTYAIITLGCPKNEIDSEILAAQLEESGWRRRTDARSAAVVIINTCAFIEDAKTQSIETVFDAVAAKNSLGFPRVIVAGCLPERYRDRLFRLLPEVDSFLGTNSIPSVAAAAEDAFAGRRTLRVDEFGSTEYIDLRRRRLGSGCYAYLRVSEGCRNRCSYCVIPSIRGTLTSRSPETITEEARQLSEDGAREIILVGQDTTRYGADTGGRTDLLDLLRRIERLPDVRWIRLLYTHPSGWTEKLVQYMCDSEKVCRYADIPFQHVSDRVLKEMNRPYTQKDILSLINKLRRAIPDVAIRTSFIVGFPGETEREFQELCSFVELHELDHVGVFTYSREEGTPAYDLRGQRSSAVKQRRWQELMDRQLDVVQRRAQTRVGTSFAMVIENRCGKGCREGRLEIQAPEIDGMTRVRGAIEPGAYALVRVVGFDDFDLRAEIVSRNEYVS